MYTLISADAIAHRVKELGLAISAAYQDRPLTVVGVLNGSVIFVADLMRSIEVSHRVAFLHASSYRGAVTQPGALAIGTLPRLTNRDVLIVDDILDTGHTLKRLQQELQQTGARSVRTAVLLWKSDRTEDGQVPDFFGFQIPNEFVVGYGLDYDDDYRHLPTVNVLEAGDISA